MINRFISFNSFTIKLTYIFLVCVFALPQYFGIPLPLFALTAQRIVLLWLLFKLFTTRDAYGDLLRSFTGTPFLVCLPFIFIASLTALVRADISSVFNFLFDAFIPMLILIFAGKEYLNINKVFNLLSIIVTVVCIVAILDVAILHKNLYEYIHTISSISGGSAFRANSYRAAAMCSHPIAFGMYLVLMLPIICFDTSSMTVNLCNRPVALLLMCGAILCCGSRMPQVTFIFELLSIYILTDSHHKKLITPYLVLFVITSILLIYLLRDERHVHRIILLNFYQLVDSIFGTDFVLRNYGYWQAAYIKSWDYRNLLPKLFLSKNYDPLVGLGAKAANYSNFSAIIDGRTVASIDNYYVLQYLQYGYPGLIAILLVFFYFLIFYINGIFCKQCHLNRLMAMLFVSLCLYLVNLWFVADLGTFKYLFSLFGLIYGFNLKNEAAH